MEKEFLPYSIARQAYAFLPNCPGSSCWNRMVIGRRTVLQSILARGKANVPVRGETLPKKDDCET